ncbi:MULTISPECIES: recombinase-like helix-turn-helix domain-containing protein [Hoyosella]|uniref:Recombinase-like domain-containing protein n=2 Tax=Hoyosella TaxID=697025 RepID=F6EFM1_HOYSD|nr:MULTISPECIES: recombinase-like helix-turn-helix domain-containing protein [Hoyosella]AEF40950.1 hypothetical protein AS9A_2503 [Hoyosella subflava DQS3-9A1]MBB3036809.1 hypothetical protein [Hoyosella altamirensis]
MSTQYLEVHQTRSGDLSPYEEKLAGSLMEIFSRGTHDLAGVVDGLNRLGLTAPDGNTWTEANFRAEMKRLGE